MRMVDDAQRQLSAVDFVHHRQMLLRLHQECGARVARESRGIFRVHRVLDVGDGAHFFYRVVADDEAAAFERELALGLCDYGVHARAAYRCCLHRFSLSLVMRPKSRVSVIESKLSVADWL